MTKPRPQASVQSTKCYRCTAYAPKPTKVRTPDGRLAWWCDACVRWVRPEVLEVTR